MHKILIATFVIGLLAGLVIANFDTEEGVDQISRPLENEEVHPADGMTAQELAEVTNIPSPAVSASKVIDLSGQGLSQTPSYVFERTDTQELDVSKNNLDGSLPAEVRHLQELRVLNLSNNNFTGVPAEIGQLGKLEVLNLANNQLTGLPYELGNLSNLKILDLRGNAYSTQDLAVIKESLPAGVVIVTE